MLSLLRREGALWYRRNNLVPVLTCNLLYAGFKSHTSWPVEFIKVYLEDALGDRVWVDDELAQPFITELLTSVIPNYHPLAQEYQDQPLLKSPERDAKQTEVIEIESGTINGGTETEKLSLPAQFTPRYTEQELVEVIGDFFSSMTGF